MPDSGDRPERTTHEKYERSIELARTKNTIKVAVVHPLAPCAVAVLVAAARRNSAATSIR